MIQKSQAPQQASGVARIKRAWLAPKLKPARLHQTAASDALGGDFDSQPS